VGHSDLIRQIQIQRPMIARTGSPCQFCLRDPRFLPIQPAVHSCSKIFTVQSWFLCFEPWASL